jgi:uncharacterized repeat protein (TIGR03806 family)
VRIASLLAVLGACGGGPPARAAETQVADFHPDRHVPWESSRVVGSPEPPLPFTTERWRPDLPDALYVHALAEPGRRAMLLALLPGGDNAARVVRIDEDPQNNEFEKLLELPRPAIIYSLAFHPDYAENGLLYLGTNTNPDDPGARNRILRYRVDENGKIDPASELSIIEWDSGGHNGAALVFGHDGMLYVTAGDGTQDSDLWISAQDVTNLCGSVLRIDVDRPEPGKTYAIPPDNPFLHVPNARGELWAIGLRNPWRMAIDRKTGQIWVGNNGQDMWETVHLLGRGDNYGWSVFEGSHSFYASRPMGPGKFVKPTREHHHREARSLTGGEVYYGSQIPELQGAYLYGDHVTGKIWGVRHDGERELWSQELADTALAIVAFAETHSGELLVVDYSSGLHRIVRNPPEEAPVDFPRKLSETGIFASVKDHQVAPGVIPYEVNAPAWADGMTALRYVALPPNVPMLFEETRGLDVGEGGVAVQTLLLPGENGRSRRVETRLLHRYRGDWNGYSYLWNDAQDDAELVESDGREVVLPVTDGSHDGEGSGRTYRVPSRSECMSCHSRAAGFLCGLSQPQLNRSCDYPSGPENQLAMLMRIGVMTGEVPRPLDELPKVVNPYDETQPLEDRARAYLHTNCSVCHVITGGGNAHMELEVTTPAAAMRVIDAYPQHDSLGVVNARIVAPGDPERSVMYQRISRRGPGQMPPLVTAVVDEQARQLFYDWIKGLPPSRNFVREWTVAELEPELLGSDRETSVKNGRRVFREAGCMQCHRLFHEGGGIGPELTGIARRQPPAKVLESIVDPSAVIAPEFVNVVLITVDGQALAGSIQREDDKIVSVKTTGAVLEPVEIPVEDIVERWPSPTSAMPAGLLNTWQLQEIADLFAYLTQDPDQYVRPDDDD